MYCSIPVFYSKYDGFTYLSFKGVPLQVPHYRNGSDVIQKKKEYIQATGTL